jgi:hypothetical protein
MPEGCKGLYKISEIITTVKEYRDKFDMTPDLSANPLRQGILRDLDIALVRLRSVETGMKFLNATLGPIPPKTVRDPESLKYISEGKYPADEVEET